MLQRVDAAGSLEARALQVGEDLTDTVVRRLFSAGLGLQGLLSMIEIPAVRCRVEAVIDEIDLTIRDVRSAILDLQR
ncbi:MAG TPA: hypothetical protein VFA11_00320 [Acidimicrobiales bacterium]|nr:hypothetical protein [Acidimicrobiales bacterium]